MAFERFPDLEVYIKDTPVQSIADWLMTIYPNLQVEKEGDTFQELHLSGAMKATLRAKNGGARFTSVLFEPNETEWNTDQELARAIFPVFNKEVRCSIGAWENEQEVVDTYWRISKHGEGPFDWDTGDP